MGCEVIALIMGAFLLTYGALRRARLAFLLGGICVLDAVCITAYNMLN